MHGYGQKHRCWAEIDLAALERNLGRIRATLPGHIKYVSVVKADAYGHGIHQVATRLMQSHVDLFAVATIYEGVDIREIGSGFPILVLGPILPGEEEVCLEYALDVCISSAEQVERFEGAARKVGKLMGVHLKIDTGMGRMGIWHEEALGLYARIKDSEYLELKGIYTHLSSADLCSHYTNTQKHRFTDFLKKLPVDEISNLLIHADNSAGLETFNASGYFNAVRIGLLQFGSIPHKDSILEKIKPEPVLSFHARVGLIKKLDKDMPVGYNQTCILERDTTIGIVTAGYADGIPSSLSNKGEVLVKGKRCKILGRVCMDMIMIDLTDIQGVSIGDIVTLIGSQENEVISLEEFSLAGNILKRETLCSITKRVPRTYKTVRLI